MPHRIPQPPFTDRLRLEPLGPEHNERDHAAWMTSIDYIHGLPGFQDGEWGDDPWPYPMSLAENKNDLVKHREEFDAGIAFVYSVIDPETDDVVGCVYIDPDNSGPAEMVMRCWTRVSHAHLDAELATVVIDWLAADWAFLSVRTPGR